MEWTDKPVICTNHAVARYKGRFMIERGEAMTDEQVVAHLKSIVTPQNFDRRVKSGALEFRGSGITLVVAEEEFIRKVLTVKDAERHFQRLWKQARAIRKVLDKRRKRWLG